MKHINKLKQLVMVVAVLVSSGVIYSCSKWDEFKEYNKDGEIQYTGKLDSVKIFSGKGRIMLSGYLKADPKIKKVKIFWNDRKDSVEYVLDKKPEIEKFEKIIPVEEGVKSFTIFTYDGAGNRSVAVNAIGASYGDSYRRKMSNRLINSYTFEPARTIINWEQMDLSTGAQYTEVQYTNAGQAVTLVTPANDPTTALNGLTSSQNIRYRTIFKPDATSIDTFAMAFKEQFIKIVPQLKNRMVPFKAAARQGRWGTLADWQSNANVKIHAGGHGGWDEWNGNIFNVESGWGAPAVTNGKIWQILTVDPGTYTFEISNLRDTNLSESDNAYLVVAAGQTLPDVAQVGSALGSVKVTAQKPVSALKVKFTLTQKTEVSMGYLTTQSGGDPGRFCNIRAFDFYENR